MPPFRTALLLCLLAAPAGANDLTARVWGGASALLGTDLSFGDGPGTAEDFDIGFAAGGAVGFDYADSPFRSEIEFAYRTGDAEGDGGDFASTSVMANLYYEFEGPSALTPYVGGGLGYVTEIDFDVASGPNAGEYSDRGGAAFQLMAGASYAFTPRVAIDGELRYFDAGSRTLGGPGGDLDADYATVEAIVALRISF